MTIDFIHGFSQMKKAAETKHGIRHPEVAWMRINDYYHLPFYGRVDSDVHEH